MITYDKRAAALACHYKLQDRIHSVGFWVGWANAWKGYFPAASVDYYETVLSYHASAENHSGETDGDVGWALGRIYRQLRGK